MNVSDIGVLQVGILTLEKHRFDWYVKMWSILDWEHTVPFQGYSKEMKSWELQEMYRSQSNFCYEAIFDFRIFSTNDLHTRFVYNDRFVQRISSSAHSFLKVGVVRTVSRFATCKVKYFDREHNAQPSLSTKTTIVRSWMQHTNLYSMPPYTRTHT